MTLTEEILIRSGEAAAGRIIGHWVGILAALLQQVILQPLGEAAHRPARGNCPMTTAVKSRTVPMILKDFMTKLSIPPLFEGVNTRHFKELMRIAMVMGALQPQHKELL